MPQIKISIVDDHDLFRKGTSQTLRDEKDFKVLFEATNGQEFLDSLAKELPDVVLLDLKMPVLDGWRTCEILNAKYPAIKVLVLTMYDDEQVVSEVVRSGAAGYLLKDVTGPELCTAIRQVNKSGYYFNELLTAEKIRKMLSRTYVHMQLNEEPGLSSREVEVLKLLCMQMTNNEIGEKLFLSPNTVNTHRMNLLDKVGAKNIAGLVIYAMRNGIID